MENEVSRPQPTRLETAKGIAMEKGAERRQKISRRIGRFFSGIKERITKGVDFALGSSDAAGYLGREAVGLGKEKAEEARDAVVEAGVRTWEKLVDTKERLVQKGKDSRDRLVTRYEQTRDVAKERIAEFSKRAAVWGLTKIAEPVEDRLRVIYELPAGIREWQAGKVDVKAQKQETRARLAKEVGEARVSVLQDEIAKIQETTLAQIDGLDALRDSALGRSQELRGKAADRRKWAENNFGKARSVVEALEVK